MTAEPVCPLETTIIINNGGTLIVSNTVAASTKKLDTLTMNGGALTLFVNGTNSTPYVYVTNFNTAGSPDHQHRQHCKFDNAGAGATRPI